MSTYTVKYGDTLSQIAAKFNVKGGYQALASYNNIANPNKIFAGQTLNIPGTSNTQSGNKTSGSTTNKGTTNKGGDTTAKSTSETVYTVKSGDTLSKIASKFNVSGGYQALAKYNGIANPNIIHVGQKIRIPGTTGGSSGGSSNTANKSSKNDAPSTGKAAVSTNGVPLYAQGDQRWGSRYLGNKNHTIRSAGCAMTSTAMTISKIGGSEINPGQLDEYLDNHGGYSGNCIIWNVAAKKIGRSATCYSYHSKSVVDNELDAGRPVVISVKSEGHWVCIAGRRADGTYIIHDPAGGKIKSAKWNSGDKRFKVDGYGYGKCLRTF